MTLKLAATSDFVDRGLHQKTNLVEGVTNLCIHATYQPLEKTLPNRKSLPNRREAEKGVHTPLDCEHEAHVAARTLHATFYLTY